MGSLSVQTFFARNTAATATENGWLEVLWADSLNKVTLRSMHRVMVYQDAEEVVGASDRVFKHFFDSLSEVIGEALSDQLLYPPLKPYVKPCRMH
jgi:hypothetical protein